MQLGGTIKNVFAIGAGLCEALLKEAEGMKKVEIVEGPRPLRFDADGNLLDFS